VNGTEVKEEVMVIQIVVSSLLSTRAEMSKRCKLPLQDLPPCGAANVNEGASHGNGCSAFVLCALLALICLLCFCQPVRCQLPTEYHLSMMAAMKNTQISESPPLRALDTQLSIIFMSTGLSPIVYIRSIMSLTKAPSICFS
jgi:preprotein translocase subunit SecY